MFLLLSNVQFLVLVNLPPGLVTRVVRPAPPLGGVLRAAARNGRTLYESYMYCTLYSRLEEQRTFQRPPASRGTRCRRAGSAPRRHFLSIHRRSAPRRRLDPSRRRPWRSVCRARVVEWSTHRRRHHKTARRSPGSKRASGPRARTRRTRARRRASRAATLRVPTSAACLWSTQVLPVPASVVVVGAASGARHLAPPRPGMAAGAAPSSSGLLLARGSHFFAREISHGFLVFLMVPRALLPRKLPILSFGFETLVSLYAASSQSIAFKVLFCEPCAMETHMRLQASCLSSMMTRSHLETLTKLISE